MPEIDVPPIVTKDYRGPDRRESPVMAAGAIADSWVPFLTKSGLAGIALFLVYILTVELRVDVRDVKSGMALHVTASEKSEKTLNSLVNVAVQQCINVATTDAKKDACFVALAFAPVRDPK